MKHYFSVVSQNHANVAMSNFKGGPQIYLSMGRLTATYDDT